MIETAERACLTATTFTESELVEIMAAHPRLGAPKTQLSTLSRNEQGYNPSQQQSTEEQDKIINDELKRLNDEYEERFGFKFVMFVDGRPRTELIEPFKRRLLNDRAQELSTGLREMVLIARDRLKKLRIE